MHLLYVICFSGAQLTFITQNKVSFTYSEALVFCFICFRRDASRYAFQVAEHCIFLGTLIHCLMNQLSSHAAVIGCQCYHSFRFHLFKNRIHNESICHFNHCRHFYPYILLGVHIGAPAFFHELIGSFYFSFSLSVSS